MHAIDWISDVFSDDWLTGPAPLGGDADDKAVDAA
jgi:hypothetical protein